jgi:hypothetical protein
MSSNILADNAITIYRGSSKTYLLTVTDEDGEIQNLTGASIYFTVKCDVKDSLAKIQKSSAQATEIEIHAPTEGKAKIYLGPTDTQNMDPGKYVFDVWVQLASGKRYPVIKPSTFKVEHAVTVLS